MSITACDPSLPAQLTSGNEVELQDPSGKVLGVFVPNGLGKLPPASSRPLARKKWQNGGELQMSAIPWWTFFAISRAGDEI